MIALRQPGSADLDAILAEQSGQALSYSGIGATRTGPPSGYRQVHHSVYLGEGGEVFGRASDGLRQWQAHRRAGVTIRPEGAGLEEGLTVVLAVPVAVAWVTVACRIVYVIEQPARFGFAYGTLPHHVIDGEEAFVIEQDEAHAVRFVVSAFLRPRGPLMSAAGPVVHRLDRHLVRRYLKGLRTYVAEAV